MSLTFIPNDNPANRAAVDLAEAIRTHLDADEYVLWLVSGGSCVPVATEVARILGSVPSGLLKIMLVDERYGAVGHTGSNSQQLVEAGFELHGAQFMRTLVGLNLHETIANFQENLVRQLEAATWKIGLFGIGSDGHTAGILPGSMAVTSKELVTGFEAIDFERITITPAAMALLDEAYVVAAGPAKQTQLVRLESSLPEAQQPAQALKRIKIVHIYSDKESQA